MKYLILDVETTILNKGNPFTNENKLCYTGYKLVGCNDTSTISHLQSGSCTSELQAVLDNADYLVCFNAKFDCHWLERIGCNLSRLRIWDCQYAEFIFNNQLTKYPSLEGAAIQYDLGHKLDIVKTEYWEKGVDTPEVPLEIMLEYLEQDVAITEKLFLLQQKRFKEDQASKWRLFQLHMEDQHCLREMEKNGILYDVQTSLEKVKDAELQIKGIEEKLRVGYEGVPLNWNSGDHLSAFLYGGSIVVESRIPIGVYKTGAKTGQPRYKVVEHKYELPAQFVPLKNSELKKDGYYATDDKTLKQLKGTKSAKERLGLLDQRAKWEKLRGTYYEGFPKKIAEMGWSDNTIHSSLNQCSVVTGRISSTQPNQQNMPPECKQLAISRYK
jgi:DNA polymerase-1